MVSDNTHNFHKQRRLKAQPALNPWQRPVDFGEWRAVRPARGKALILKMLIKDAFATTGRAVHYFSNSTLFFGRQQYSYFLSQCSLSQALTGSSNSFRLAHATRMLTQKELIFINKVWSVVTSGCSVAHAPCMP